jgi:dTDP-4-amino-4,6-dideoxygalactose transaminase
MMSKNFTNPVIAKGAVDKKKYFHPVFTFANARTAFKAYLYGLNFGPDQEILLPAYIGWTQKEGSGVFDPIQELGLRYRFYRVHRDLSIDRNDVLEKISVIKPKLLVLIHYFGYPDKNSAAIIKFARERGVLVLEDEAHALLSDWIGGICGREGNAAIMSLHKILPFKFGGLLVLQDFGEDCVVARMKAAHLDIPLESSPMDYDLLNISNARRQNALKLLELLRPLAGKVDPLFPLLPDGVVPQTLPVVIRKKPRNDLYFALSESGYGVITLYHTLIDAIRCSEFPDSHWLSSVILNLPIHQDVTYETMERMIARIKELV